MDWMKEVQATLSDLIYLEPTESFGWFFYFNESTIEIKQKIQ